MRSMDQGVNMGLQQAVGKNRSSDKKRLKRLRQGKKNRHKRYVEREHHMARERTHYRDWR